MKKKLVLKIGTSTLTAATDRISYAKIEDIARQIVELQDDYDIVLVSSGAIAMAKQNVHINGYQKDVESRQALAAIGQPQLMAVYREVFQSFGLKIGQCLLVYRDFESEKARNNISNTIHKLLELGYIPIINENDTVAVDEIVLGDNDKLSAYVAVILDANLLVLASDINGLYDKNPFLHEDAKLIQVINNLEEVVDFIQEKKSTLGTGGMTTKLHAAKICQQKNVEMWIVNGNNNRFLCNALEGKISFSKFK